MHDFGDMAGILTFCHLDIYWRRVSGFPDDVGLNSGVKPSNEKRRMDLGCPLGTLLHQMVT